MVNVPIAQYGSLTVLIPSGQKIAVQSDAQCSVYSLVGYPNFPSTQKLEFVANAGIQTVSSAFGSDTYVTVAAGPALVYYDIGSAPSITNPEIIVQDAPIAKTVTVTLTIADLKTGIITGTHSAGATQTYTLPTGTLSDAGLSANVNDSFDWFLINLSAAAADTITVAAGTGHTIVGNAVVQSSHASTGALYGNAAHFRTRKTAENTFVTYRVV